MTGNRCLSAIRGLLLPGKEEKLSITTLSTFPFPQLPMSWMSSPQEAPVIPAPGQRVKQGSVFYGFESHFSFTQLKEECK